MSDRWRPLPRRVEPGEWPEVETALAAVNRDVVATLPDQQPLVLMLSPSVPFPAEGVGDLPERLYVALADGRWQGNAVHPYGVDACDAAEPADPFMVLRLVAEAAQDTVLELLWQAWPICPAHGIGTHPRPAGTAGDWVQDWHGNSGHPVWWCRGGRGGECHDVARVGELAGALPGKRRRELRRAERKRGSHR